MGVSLGNPRKGIEDQIALNKMVQGDVDRSVLFATEGIDTGKYDRDIERASRIGQERGLGPYIAQQRLREAQLRGEMGPPNFTFGENQEEDERAARRPKFDPKVRNYAKGGKVSSKASSRADGCAQRGKTKGRMV